MRITGGNFKGLEIKFGSKRVRPTLSKVRQAVFNTLKNDLSGYTFIDLFAGSGIMGLEALSRRADLVIFNDIDRKNLMNISSRLKIMNMTKEHYQIKTTDGIGLLKKFDRNNVIFYIDPPFGFKKMEKLIEEFEKLNGPTGIFEISVDNKYNFSYIIKEKKYGNIKIIMERRDEK